MDKSNHLSDLDDILPEYNIERNLNSNFFVRNYSHADYQYELLCEYIRNFQDTLDNNHEVGLQLASFGQSILLNVIDIGYANPSLIHFYGYYNGNKAHLIQHVNQLNFLLVSVPKLDPSKPARRIGFDTSSSNN